MDTRSSVPLPSIGVAFQAAPANIKDILFGVVIFHLLPVVAFVTVHCSFGPVMAVRANASRATVACGESVVVNLDITPATCVVAAGTLPRPVPLRPIVA